jgi:membrane peptidoglycan carboxypeptidase
MSLLEHTSGFATFANMGKHNQTTGVDRIVDGNDKLIFQNSPQNQEVVNPQAAYELVSIMTDNDARSYIFGKKNPLTLPDRLVAAKTGTTQNWKDGFTMGFTPSLAVGVWTGNNDGTLMRAGADGVVTAAPLWHAFLEEALKGTPAENFPEPDGITRLKINPATGKVIKTAKGGKLEVFASYAIPYNDFQLPKRVVKKPDLSTKKPNYNDLIENRQEETVILEPWETETVLKTPFDVKVYTGSSSLETTVELSLDGKVIANLTEAPFLYTVSDKLANGQHTLTAKATHFGLLESTDTVKFKTFFNPPPLAPRGK